MTKNKKNFEIFLANVIIFSEEVVLTHVHVYVKFQRIDKKTPGVMIFQIYDKKIQKNLEIFSKNVRILFFAITGG